MVISFEYILSGAGSWGSFMFNTIVTCQTVHPSGFINLYSCDW